MTQLSSTTANTLFTSSLSDLSSMFYTAIVPILVIAVALMGLGFAWSRIRKHVHGRKF